MTMNFEQVDASFQHPFRAIVCGPSTSGKTTFVYELLRNANFYIDQEFADIYIFLGTSIDENPIFKRLARDYPQKVHPFNLHELFKNKKTFTDDCSDFITQIISKRGKLPGCMIFDDLMHEMADGNIISKLFARYSSHSNISIIYITQNLFHKGKKQGEGTDIYRNSDILVLFRCVLDNTSLQIISSRISKNRGDKSMQDMLAKIQAEKRYVVLRGNLETPEALRITSDYFTTQPVPHFKAYSLINV